uniref:Cholesterol 24-hydroxylase n=1 Tax=Leptobrachium leishanense TaxID=445787 RepID=A0A8C5WEJ5_9ANUR
MGLWGLLTWGSLLLLSLALICFLIFCAYIKYIHMKYDHIPGPPRDSHVMLHLKVHFFQCFMFFRARDYGPIVRINVLYNVIILAVSPEAVKVILLAISFCFSCKMANCAPRLVIFFLGCGLVTDRDYDHWHKQRRVMDPAFSRAYLIGLMGPFNDNAEHLMETLSNKADGKQRVKMHDLLNRMTLDVIAKVAFAMDLNSLDDKDNPFPRAITVAISGMVETRNPFIQYLPGKRAYIKDVRDSIGLLRETGKRCIERRQRAIDEGEDVPVDILTQILKGAGKLDCCLSGQETTANQLAFTVMELGRNPHILEKVQAEVDDVIGSKRDLDYEDLGKLKYLSQVLKETLRLYPTAPGTSRGLHEELVINGVRIPPKTTVMFNSYIMGRMEEYFEDPLTFNPDRFHPEAPKPNFTYFPFSLGPRSCIGRVFAQMEAKVVMAKLIQRFNFTLVEGQSFKVLDLATLRPLDGVVCTVRTRTTNGK